MQKNAAKRILLCLPGVMPVILSVFGILSGMTGRGMYIENIM